MWQRKYKNNMDYLPIENYGLIGNMRTVALVGTNGSIDWFCYPHVDSPSVFGALLDHQKGGFFRIHPIDTDYKHKQFYWPDTNVLVTRFLTEEGVSELIDYMPVGPSDFTEGEALTFIPYFHCGQCIACRTGRPNCCVDMQVCGVHVDGGMAEYLSVPSSSLLKGQGLALDTLALVEPLAIGAHGVRRAAIQNGEFVLVVGAGPIGLGTMAFARLSGGNVIALDLNEQRLQFCRDKLNIQHTLNAMDTEVLEKLRTITKGDMPTVVMDATGSQKAINHSFQYMAHGARYVLIGLQKGNITFSHPEFHKREGSLMSSRNATRQDFERVISVLKNDTIHPGTFITHRTTFDRVGQEFSNWLNPENGVIKAMIEFH